MTVPIIGEKNTVAEPKVDTALSAIETWANGNVGLENLENKGVTEAKLSTAVQTLLNEKTAGGTLKKSIIATEETRESAVYGTLTTPDEVEVTVVENGLVAVWYQASWKETVNSAARAAIFIGANQMKAAADEKPELVSAATGGTNAGSFCPLGTTPLGLASLGTLAYTGDVTTGQAVGIAGVAHLNLANAGTITMGSGAWGGPCYIFGLAAGAYKISVQFKASSGKVTAKKRRLLALAYA